MRLSSLRSYLLYCGAVMLMHASAVSADPFESLLMPGPLIEGHADLEDDCNNCHRSFSDEREETRLCLECHDDIRADVLKRRGFHGHSKQVRKQSCRSCHTDHQGRDADIIKFNPATFDHHLTDFPLRGQHARTACENCHKKGKKFREAPGRCHACHKDADPHRGRLGKHEKKCQVCHRETGWTAILFDHSLTDFDLTGKHKKTDCASCHPNDRYAKTPQDCYSCHRLNDSHGGGNGKKCKKCHSTRAWDDLDFDHDTETDFPLRGEHRDLSCQRCHKKDPYKVELKTGCVNCHREDDVHKGRNGRKCKDCHSPKGWRHTRFDHDHDTDFPLRGKHKKAKCIACHKRNPKEHETDTACIACHRVDDVHKGQQGKECQRCHNERGWQHRVRFDHDLTRFPLLGLHAVTPCEECHLSGAYRDAETRCHSCHREDDEHRGRLGLDCERCHTPNSWELWKFDHNAQARFKLKHKHAKQHCYACHRRKVKKVASVPRPCDACHAADDAHNGQFGSNCERCHTTRSFRDVQLRR